MALQMNYDWIFTNVAVCTLQDLIFPLLELVASTEKHKEGPEMDLGKRAGNMFRMLYKKAKVCTSPSTLQKGKCWGNLLSRK